MPNFSNGSLAPAIRLRALMQLTQMVCFLWLGGAAIRAALAL